MCETEEKNSFLFYKVHKLSRPRKCVKGKFILTNCAHSLNQLHCYYKLL